MIKETDILALGGIKRGDTPWMDIPLGSIGGHPAALHLCPSETTAAVLMEQINPDPADITDLVEIIKDDINDRGSEAATNDSCFYHLLAKQSIYLGEFDLPGLTTLVKLLKQINSGQVQQ